MLVIMLLSFSVEEEEVCLEEVRAGMDGIVRRACDSSHGRLGLTCLRFLSFFFIV
jgi:hypothetical protein